MSSEKGFAMIEIILLTLIISVLTATAVPKISKMLEKVSLDYETKKMYSELRFVQSVNRSATFDEAFFQNKIPNSKPVMFQASSTFYQIFRGDNNHLIRPRHNMSRNISLTFSSDKMRMFWFEPYGKVSANGSITIKSNVGERKMIFDSVGRWRAE